MNIVQLLGAVELGFIYSLVALGVYLSFRTLDFPDLSIDGTFPLGAAVAGSCILYGMNPWLATFIAILAGAVAGYITAILATRLKMLNLLAGILTMTALYSINLRIMGRPNLALLGEETLATQLSHFFSKVFGFSDALRHHSSLMGLAIIILVTVLILEWFLKTRKGLALRSIGSNPRMARSIGINDQTMIQMGLALSNALVALAGALFAQVYGFADVSMGVGTIIIGLAAVIIGEALFNIRSVAMALMACIVGAILYRMAIAFALETSEFGLQASDLNLVTAVIVAFAMLVPQFKRSVNKAKKKVTKKTSSMTSLSKGESDE